MTPEILSENTNKKKTKVEIEGNSFFETKVKKKLIIKFIFKKKLKIWEKRMESLESSVKKMVKILVEMKARNMKNNKFLELKKPKNNQNFGQSNEINIIKKKSKDEKVKRKMIKAALQKYNLENSEKSEDL